MQQNLKLALIVAYYLSRFYVDRKDRSQLENIGVDSGITKAYEEIGKRLDVNPRTLKNMRDHFEPLHGHRSGWHQEATRPSHIEIYEKYKDLSEEALVEVVKDIIDINGSNKDIKHNIDIYIDIIDSKDDEEHVQKPKKSLELVE